MDLRTNLWKIYCYKFLSEFYLVVPVLIPYYMKNGLTSTQVFAVQAAYALGVLLLEVPSGYLADVVGRKKTLILGAVFLPLGLCVYAFTGSFLTFVLAETLIAVGNSMRSGCDSALIYDTLLRLEREGDYKKFEGRTQFFTRVGSTTASASGGFAALLSLHAPFYINIATSLFMLPLALSLTEPERTKRNERNPFADIVKICAASLLRPQTRTLILLTSLVMSTGITGVWAYFLYYASLGIPVSLTGIIFAATQLVSAFGSPAAHRVAALFGVRRTLKSLLLIGPGFILVGLFHSPLLIAVIMANMFLWNLSFPLLLDEINKLITSDIRATVLSTASMGGCLAFAILSPLFGRLADRTSLGTAFVTMGIAFIAIGMILFLAYSRHFPGASKTAGDRA